MSWIKSGENLYSHDKAPFVLENVNGTWGIRDTRDKTQFIPFSDIFNNPVFPLDLSNADVIVKTLQSLGSIVGQSLQILGSIVGNSIESLGAITGNTLTITNAILGKHFRGENAGGSATPIFSAQGDINTGFYHISDGVFGWSSNGIKKGEFGSSYGGFTGNIVQIVSATQNFQTVITTNTFQNINSGSGIIWEASIIPKMSNSKFFVLYKLATSNGGSGDYFGFKILNKVNSGGTYTTIYDPQKSSNDQNAIEIGATTTGFYMIPIIPTLHAPTYLLGDTLFYKIMGAIFSSSTLTINQSRTGTGTNSGHSEVYILEIANI